MLKKMILVGFLLTLIGCVGIQPITSTAKREHGPPIGSKVGDLAYREGVSTKSDVLRTWGEPKRKYIEGDKEHWVYNRDLAWRGIVLWLVAPIPLLVPAGMNETTVQFDEEKVIKFWNEYGDDSGAVGCVWGADGSYRCGKGI